MLFENLGNPVFGERIWNIFAYSLVGSVGMLCSFMCMVCLLGVVQRVTLKRVLLYLAPIVGCPLIGVISGCFFRFTEGSNAENMILRILLLVIFFMYFIMINIRIYEKFKILKTLELFLTYAGLILYIGSLFSAFSMFQKDSILTADIYRSFTFRSIPVRTSVLFGVLIPLVLITIGLYVVMYRKQRFYKFGTVCIILLMIWSSIVSYVASLTVQKEDETMSVMRYVLFMLIFSFSVILPIIIWLLGYRRVLEEQNRYQESYLESELSYIEQYKKSQERTREFRHDVTNNLTVLMYLLKEGKKSEASVYLDDMVGQVQNLALKYVTGDEMLDCIVAMKTEKMEKENIRFSLEGGLENGLHMKPLEICTIFANLLDNAIEAQKKISDPQKEKWVEMSIKKSDQFFVIKIRNATDGLVAIDRLNKAERYTSKKDISHHGFGLQNIRQTVEGKNGVLKFENSENSFTVSVMLPRNL